MPRQPRVTRSDGDATRVRILESAGRLIARSGYADVTNKDVAAKAGVDLASINYHFGSRSGLYDAVLAEAHRRLVNLDELQKLIASDLEPEAQLRGLFKLLLTRTRQPQAWPISVLGREIFSPSSHLRTLREGEVEPKLSLVLKILENMTGIPERDPLLLQCLVSVAAPCMMLLISRKGASPVADGLSEVPDDVLAEQLCHFAIGGLDAVRKRYKKVADDV